MTTIQTTTTVHTRHVTKDTEPETLYMNISGPKLCNAESFDGSEISKEKSALIFRGHAVQEAQLLVTDYWLNYLDRCSIPDAAGITLIRRVGNQSPDRTASHRCGNLKSGTVVCISHT